MASKSCVLWPVSSGVLVVALAPVRELRALPSPASDTSVTEPPVSATETRREPTETDPPVSTVGLDSLITSVRAAMSVDHVTLPSVSGARPRS